MITIIRVRIITLLLIEHNSKIRREAGSSPHFAQTLTLIAIDGCYECVWKLNHNGPPLADAQSRSPELVLQKHDETLPSSNAPSVPIQIRLKLLPLRMRKSQIMPRGLLARPGLGNHSPLTDICSTFSLPQSDAEQDWSHELTDHWNIGGCGNGRGQNTDEQDHLLPRL